MPYYFYIYNISSNDSAAIQTTRAKIYLFTIGTLYKIGSRILILASTGQGIFPSNVPARSHSGPQIVGLSYLGIDTGLLIGQMAFARVGDRILKLIAKRWGNGEMKPAYRLPLCCFGWAFYAGGILL
jgi:hypothetical protein